MKVYVRCYDENYGETQRSVSTIVFQFILGCS